MASGAGVRLCRPWEDKRGCHWAWSSLVSLSLSFSIYKMGLAFVTD